MNPFVTAQAATTLPHRNLSFIYGFFPESSNHEFV